jgi:putative nucleotidyltransferase with HDIG domain
MEVKDWETSGHTERVADIAVALARRLGYRGSDLEAIEVGALLHDIGKIGVPEQILHKPGPLDDAEWDMMKQHPVIAEYILSGIDLPPIVHEIARWSHERVDGAGYPDGLAGNAIPLPAQIAFVADAFDAITTDRPSGAAGGRSPPFRRSGRTAERSSPVRSSGLSRNWPAKSPCCWRSSSPSYASPRTAES